MKQESTVCRGTGRVPRSARERAGKVDVGESMLRYLCAERDANKRDLDKLIECAAEPLPDYQGVVWDGWAGDGIRQAADVGGLTLNVFHPVVIIWLLSRDPPPWTMHAMRLLIWCLLIDPWARPAHLPKTTRRQEEWYDGARGYADRPGSLYRPLE